MAVITVIECDRCNNQTGTGVTYTVDRIVVGLAGNTHNINQFEDRRDWALCPPCAVDVVDFIKAGN